MFLTLKAKQLTENLPAPTAKLSHASPNSPMKTHLQMTSLLKPTLTRPSPPNLRLPEQSSPKRAEKDTAEAVCATADAEKNAAEAARATADAAKDAVEAARAVANAEVLRLNMLTGGATAGASASGAPAAGASAASATLFAPQIAQMISGFMALLTTLIQDNRRHTEQY